MPSWLTVMIGSVLTGAAAAIPVVAPAIGEPWTSLAAGLIALAGQAYHLYQPPPNSKPSLR